MRITQEVIPRNHERKVMTGRVGSSVSGTTRATSSIGHLSSGGTPFAAFSVSTEVGL
ncbi:hypothetical protein A2U01_0115112, partial [Trifolium medium]|nr:hypothetical protein [Trifolium medium]